MAIFHLRARTLTRGGGASAAAAAAYALRLGKFSKASLDPCVFSETGNMPAWAAGPRQRLSLFHAADAHERKGGRLAKTLEVALPLELNHAQRVALAREFCSQVARTATGEPLPFLVAIHAGKNTNPHAHVMICERVLDGHHRTPETWFSRASPKGKNPAQGGARKTEDLKPKAWLLATRELLARLTNESLAQAGFMARVDHRSLAAQGIDRVPGVHLGPAGAARLRRGVRSRRADDLAERREEALAARGLIDELAREANQIKAELATLQATPTTKPTSRTGTAAMLARAERERAAGRRDSNSTTKERGNDYANPGLR